MKNYKFPRLCKTARNQNTPITKKELKELISLGDSVDLAQIRTIYTPLVLLLIEYIQSHKALSQTIGNILPSNVRVSRSPNAPFIIGIAGSVAVGKSTTARLLRTLLRSHNYNTDLITTDGFLLSNQKLMEKNIFHKKGFPESYDRKKILQCLMDIWAGCKNVKVPVYSHLEYDVVPGVYTYVNLPDVLIVEGVNVLLPPSKYTNLAISDFFDLSIYIDAKEKHIQTWYIKRFLKLKKSAFCEPKSYFLRYSKLSKLDAIKTAKNIWQRINLPNLKENIEAGRARANIVLCKNKHHKISKIIFKGTDL